MMMTTLSISYICIPSPRSVRSLNLSAPAYHQRKSSCQSIYSYGIVRLTHRYTRKCVCVRVAGMKPHAQCQSSHISIKCDPKWNNRQTIQISPNITIYSLFSMPFINNVIDILTQPHLLFLFFRSSIRGSDSRWFWGSTAMWSNARHNDRW